MEYDDIMISHNTPLHTKKRLERLEKKMKQEINNEINLGVDLIIEDDNNDDEVQIIS